MKDRNERLRRIVEMLDDEGFEVLEVRTHRDVVGAEYSDELEVRVRIPASKKADQSVEPS